MNESGSVAKAVHELVLAASEHVLDKPRVVGSDDAVWRQVRETGTRLWLDTGSLEEASELWTAEFDALTTNNTLLNREVQKGIYDELVTRAAAAIRAAKPDIGEDELVLELAFVLNARHGLKLVEQFGVNVSVELHTDLANDPTRTVAYGRRFYAVCPERFYVKVPLTPAGFLGARALSDAGIPINFTLGFSARHNYVAALLARPSFVNVFMGRLNAFVADSGLGDGQNVGEKATLSTQRQLRSLRAEGRTGTLLIGASMRDGPQVASLAGLDVYTMPPKVAAQYHDSPAGPLSPQVDTDPPVEWAEGVRGADLNAASLWDVPDSFRECVDSLVARDVASLTTEDVREHFGGDGHADFLPTWSDEERATVASDGKIPAYGRWKERLASGELGLDALMNISALLSFATDQKALDDRIRSLL